MVNIDTNYDYKIHKRYYTIRGDKGYTKTTDIVLNLDTITDTNLEYCTATFNVNVFGDRNTGDIVFYDNGTPISVIYGNDVIQVLNWSSDNTNAVTIAMQLSYDVEHKIYARYLGNDKCLASKSRVYDILEDRPAHYLTTIELTSATGGIYESDDSVEITGVLVAEGHNSNQTIEIYVDNEYITSVSTGSGGNFTYTNSHLADGIHSIKAVYRGSSYLYSCESQIPVSLGYNISVVYDEVWLEGIGSITATVKDYFGNLIDNATVTCDLDGVTILEATTDNGVAVLTNENHQIELSNPISVECAGSESETFLPIVAYLDSFTVTPDELICSKNRSVVLSISASASDLGGTIIPLEGVKVNLTNASTDYVLLDDVNSAIAYYNGSEAGDVTVTASLGSATQSVDLEDVLFYYKGNNTVIGEDYQVFSGEIMRLMNGLKFKKKDNQYAVMSLVSVNRSTQFEFDVVNVSNATNLLLGIGHLVGNNYSSLLSMGNAGLKVNDKVKIVNNLGTSIEIYVNNTLVASQSLVTLYPKIAIRLGFWGDNEYITINNVKWKVI